MRYIDPAPAPAQDPTPKKISGPTKTRRAPDKFNRFAWRDAVYADPKTPANAKVLAQGIMKHVNGETGEAVPSTITLAKICGFSEKTVRNLIPVLQSTGWIEVQYGSRGRGQNHCNRYSINPEKRTPCTVLANRKKRTVKPDFSRLKPDPVSEEPLNHKEEEVRFKNRKRPGPQAAPRPPACWSQSPPNSAVTAADDASQSPALETDIPETEREGTKALRLCSGRVEGKEPPETQPLAALATTLLVSPAANSGTLINLAGQAARRPETKPPHHKGGTTMSRRIQSREEMFAKIKHHYPVIGLDDATNFDALALVLDHGVDFYELFADVLDQQSYAKDGRDVPQLAEFLLSRCWSESIAA